MQFEIDGVKLFYEVKGNENSETAVAFFNGVMATTNSWYGMLPGFEKLGFKIVLHDFMGQMKSDKPGEGNVFLRGALPSGKGSFSTASMSKKCI